MMKWAMDQDKRVAADNARNVAKAIAEAAEEAEAAVLAAATDAAADAAGAAEYGGSVPGMLLEWSIAALWTLCTPPPEQARPPMHPTCDPMHAA